jgi:tetratricopeptide (TPR) repeat protein
MNSAGVSITVNGAPSHLPADAATPTCLVAREVLEHAHNLAEATEIIRRRQVFVSAMFLVGSRADGKFIIVEKTPDTTAVTEPATNGNSLVCANHYLSAPLKDDPINETYKRADTSVARFERMTELLRAQTNALDAASCAAILRDRRLPGSVLAGNGHRGALNPLIATHAVVMDLTAGIFWAATPPHQLGKFVAFDLNAPEKLLPAQTLPADTLLADGGYQSFLAAKKDLDDGTLALKHGDLAGAFAATEKAEGENPGYYGNAWLLAETYFQQGQLAEAAAACRRALAGQPALAAERAKIQKLLDRCTSPK